MIVRDYAAADLPAICQLFYDAIHHAVMPYTAEQRAAWAPTVPDAGLWQARLQDQQVMVAEIDGTLAGFMTLRSDGYLDLAFVAPERQGRGVADALYDVLESRARDHGHRSLSVEASIPARSFFLRRGWREVAGQTVTRNGFALQNFQMEKQLD